MSITIWLIAFVSMTLMDIAWVLYMARAGEKRPLSASWWALVLHGFSAAATISYTDDPRYLSATGLGTMLGTYIAVERERRKALRAARAPRPAGAPMPTSPLVGEALEP